MAHAATHTGTQKATLASPVAGASRSQGLIPVAVIESWTCETPIRTPKLTGPNAKRTQAKPEPSDKVLPKASQGLRFTSWSLPDSGISSRTLDGPYVP